MNSLIHLLEAVTLLLVGVLIVQVYRCYLNFNRASVAQAKVGRSFSLQINIPSRLAEPSVSSKTMAADTSVGDTRANTATPLDTQHEARLQAKLDAKLGVKSEQSPVSDNANEQILNDYIGGFFAEAVQPDIAAFRKETNDVSPVAKLETVGSETELPSQSLLNEAPSLSLYSSDESLHGDEVITVESAPLIDPVIVDNLIDQLDESSNAFESIPVLTELSRSSDDDDSVITVIDERGLSSSSDKVMSDKVVHAMLDEARLVCAS